MRGLLFLLAGLLTAFTGALSLPVKRQMTGNLVADGSFEDVPDSVDDTHNVSGGGWKIKGQVSHVTRYKPTSYPRHSHVFG